MSKILQKLQGPELSFKIFGRGNPPDVGMWVPGPTAASFGVGLFVKGQGGPFVKDQGSICQRSQTSFGKSLGNF